MDRKSRLRPVPGGCSLGSFRITAGTLGCIVHKGGQRFILSNSHVLGGSPVEGADIGDEILQPGKADWGTVENDTIARLHEFVPLQMSGDSGCSVAKAIINICNFIAALFGRKTRLAAVTDGVNLVDCAIAKPLEDADVTDEILEVGTITGEAEPEVGMAVKKSGRTTGLTQGVIQQVGVAANINMGEGKIAVFTDQFAMGAMSQGGDSGSAILTEDNKMVGLLFAGSEMVTLANRYSNVKAELTLD